MNRRFCLLALMLVSLLTSCASLSKKGSDAADSEEVVISDGIKTTAKNEIIFDDSDLNKGEGNSAAGKVSDKITKIAADGSQINTTFDRYGNKTETRSFNYDSRLKFIMLRTSADGRKQVFVYGQNGEIKTLSENMLDKVLSAPADEIAGAAGIFQQYTQAARPTIVQNSQPPLQALPGYKFPVQQRRAPVETADAPVQPGAETEIAPPDSAEAPKQTGENPTNATKRRTESPTPNNQPDQKN